MRVALFVHCFFPEHFYGTETYTYLVAKHLMDMGHEVVVVAAVFQGEKPRSDLVTRYEYDGIPVVLIDKNKIPHRSVRETYYQPAMAGTLRGLLRELRPDVVHVTHLINHTAVLLEVAAELGLPTVGTFTDFFGFCFTNKLAAVDGSLCRGPSRGRDNCVACYLSASGSTAGRKGEWWRSRPAPVKVGSRLVTAAARVPGILGGPLQETVRDLRDRPGVLARCYRHYDVVITPTKSLRQAYERNGLTTPCVDVRFGVDIDRGPKPAHPAGRPLRIGYIGQLVHHKGVDLLLQAVAALPGGSVQAQVYGPQDQDPVFMKRLRDLALGLPVEFRGTFPPERMADVLRGLDLIVIPSRWPENSPLVLLDALATHTPVVVSDGEGLTEFLEDGRNGFRFRLGSASDLVGQLIRFVEDPALATRMSASTQYTRTSRDMVEDLIPVYELAGISDSPASR